MFCNKGTLSSSTTTTQCTHGGIDVSSWVFVYPTTLPSLCSTHYTRLPLIPTAWTGTLCSQGIPRCVRPWRPSGSPIHSTSNPPQLDSKPYALDHQVPSSRNGINFVLRRLSFPTARSLLLTLSWGELQWWSESLNLNYITVRLVLIKATSLHLNISWDFWDYKINILYNDLFYWSFVLYLNSFLYS